MFHVVESRQTNRALLRRRGTPTLDVAWRAKPTPVIGWRDPRLPPVVDVIGELPTFVGVGTAGAGTGNVTPTIPAFVDNDIGLLLCETAGEAVAAPSGWAEVNNSPIESALLATRLTIFWRRLTGSVSDPTIVDPGNHVYAIIGTFRGVARTGDPWDVSGPGGNSTVGGTTVTIPGITTTIANCLIVCALSWGAGSAGPLVSSYSNGGLGSLTERQDAGTTLGNGGGVSFATGTKAAIGATGDTTATLSSSSQWAAIHIALRPDLEVSVPAPPSLAFTTNTPTLDIVLGMTAATLALTENTPTLAIEIAVPAPPAMTLTSLTPTLGVGLAVPSPTALQFNMFAPTLEGMIDDGDTGDPGIGDMVDEGDNDMIVGRRGMLVPMLD